MWQYLNARVLLLPLLFHEADSQIRLLDISGCLFFKIFFALRQRVNINRAVHDGFVYFRCSVQPCNRSLKLAGLLLAMMHSNFVVFYL